MILLLLAAAAQDRRLRREDALLRRWPGLIGGCDDDSRMLCGWR